MSMGEWEWQRDIEGDTEREREREREKECSQSEVFRVFVPPQFTCLMKQSAELIAGVMTSDWLECGAARVYRDAIGMAGSQGTLDTGCSRRGSVNSDC